MRTYSAGAILALLSIGTAWPFLLFNGPQVNAKYSTYRKNLRGIYYISADHPLQLIEHGQYGYLGNADPKTFVVLADNWAKDKNHVWNGYTLIKEADATTFQIDRSGLAKDRKSVFIYDTNSGTYRPMRANIDVATAAYFVFKKNGQDWTWIRDKNKVWFDETEVDVDRNTFHPLGNSNWWIDNKRVYTDCWDPESQSNILVQVDTVQYPLDTLVAGSHYLRNGRNIIYLDKIIARNIDITRFEDIGVSKCVVNEMLFDEGKQILKDSLNVSKTKFYFYGHIASDGQHVFYDNIMLKDIDAQSFQQINEDTFEDRNFVYSIKDNAWQEKYPFEKRKKK